MNKSLLTGGMIVTISLLTNGCASPQLDYYQDSEPRLDVKTFFNGPIKAWGIVQNWRGQVTSRFDADMVGSWEGDVGTLREVFTFYDGRSQQRVWTLYPGPDGSLSGTAPDVQGTATGMQSGSALNLRYAMDLDVNGRTYRVHFDDWMWLMNDDLVINRAYIRKFGITVAQLTVVMQKQDRDQVGDRKAHEI